MSLVEKIQSELRGERRRLEDELTTVRKVQMILDPRTRPRKKRKARAVEIAPTTEEVTNGS